jgi:hypothetical protein
MDLDACHPSLPLMTHMFQHAPEFMDDLKACLSSAMLCCTGMNLLLCG